VRYRLRRAGFRPVRLQKVHLSWGQFAGAADLKDEPPPWDWFFAAGKPDMSRKAAKAQREPRA
jgi:hypothetical protein